MTTGSEPLRRPPDVEQRESYLRILFDSIDEGYCIAKMVVSDTGEPIDYRFLEVNPKFEEMTGLTSPVGKTALELVPELEWEWIEKYSRVALGGETLRFEQGSEAMGRWFDVFAMPVGPDGCFAIIFRDQTKRHQWEVALQESEARFRLLADDLPLPVWQHDANGHQTWVNATYSSFFGVTREEMVEERWHGLTHPEDGEAYAQEFARSVAQQSPFHGMVRVRRNDGEWRWMESWARPTYGPDGEYAGHLGTSADVTERIVAEEVATIRAARSALTAELLIELDSDAPLQRKLQRLVELFVTHLSDFAIVEAPFASVPLLAAAHRNESHLPDLIELRRHHRLNLDSDSSIARAAERGRLISLVNADVRILHASDPVGAALLTKLDFRSQLAVPLDLGDDVRGVLAIGLVGCEGRYFGTDDLAFVEDVARRVSLVLAAARIRQKEHEASVQLQRALLPDRLVEHEQLDIAARYHAASDLLEVGGDWYDTFSWPDGNIGIIVGDVVGHGLDSVASMGRLRAATAALAAHVGPNPAALIGALDGFAKGPDGTDFATALCVVIEPISGKLTYSSAGHPPAIVIEPDGTTSRLTEALSLPLCRIDADRTHQSTLVLQPGSLVVLYSDGLIERRGEHLDISLRRLEDTSRDLVGLNASDAADNLISELTASSAPQDDIVVVCVKYVPKMTPLPSNG
jgi:PAS domain S-box-containing protein